MYVSAVRPEKQSGRRAQLFEIDAVVEPKNSAETVGLIGAAHLVDRYHRGTSGAIGQYLF